MNAEFYTGDILATEHRGHTRYVRVGGPHPTEARIYVQDCDGAGFLLGNHGRHLAAVTLATRYRVHHRPTEAHQ